MVEWAWKKVLKYTWMKGNWWFIAVPKPCVSLLGKSWNQVVKVLQVFVRMVSAGLIPFYLQAQVSNYPLHVKSKGNFPIFSSLIFKKWHNIYSSSPFFLHLCNNILLVFLLSFWLFLVSLRFILFSCHSTLEFFEAWSSSHFSFFISHKAIPPSYPEF